MPCRATRPGALSRPRPPSRWPCASGNPAPVFCPACSEAIFTVPLLTPVSHPHRLAGAFPEQLLSSSWHLLSVTFFLIYHYNLVDFCLSSRILVFCERIFCGFFCHYFHGQARPGRSKGAGQAVEILGHDPGGTGLPPLAIEPRMVYDCKNTRMPDTAEKRSLWTDRISP